MIEDKDVLALSELFCKKRIIPIFIINKSKEDIRFVVVNRDN